MGATQTLTREAVSESQCKFLRQKYVQGKCGEYPVEVNPVVWLGPNRVFGCFKNKQKERANDAGCAYWNECTDILCQSQCNKMGACFWNRVGRSSILSFPPNNERGD